MLKRLRSIGADEVVIQIIRAKKMKQFVRISSGNGIIGVISISGIVHHSAFGGINFVIVKSAVAGKSVTSSYFIDMKQHAPVVIFVKIKIRRYTAFEIAVCCIGKQKLDPKIILHGCRNIP